MPHYSFFQKLYLPFFSADYYRQVGKSGKGLGLKTFFGVVTLNLLFTLAIMAVLVVVFVNDADVRMTYDQVMASLPVVTIKDGAASITEPTPYVLNDPENPEDIFLVIDTSEEPRLTPEMLHAPILVTKEQFSVRQGPGQTRSYNFSEWEDVVLDAATIADFAKSLLWIVVPFAVLILSGLRYLFRLLQVFLYATFGLIFNSILKTNLTFDQLCRLTTLALTPILILDVLLFFVWGGPQLWFFNFFLAMIFLGFGVNSQKTAA